MANQKQIKKRVSSIKNIGKITGALEMVSAAKVGKAQEKAEAARPYADKVYELVQAFSGERTGVNLPLLRSEEFVTADLYILISTNKGLAGSLNTSLFAELKGFLFEKKTDHKFITIGKKGRNFALKNGELVADYSESVPFEQSIPAIVETLISLYEEAKVDEVHLVYNDFETLMTQKPVVKQLLPILPTPSSEGRVALGARYSFEPSAEEVLASLLIFYIENQIRDAMYEGEASEHAARMIAMKNASDNAKDLSETLSLEYNKVRQAAITNEIADVVTSTESLK